MFNLMMLAMLLNPLCPTGHGQWGRSEIIPDGSGVVCLVDHDIADKYELWWASSVIGTVPVKISLTLADNRDVIRFAVAPNSGYVAYTADKNQWTKYELYSVPIHGGQSTNLSGQVLFDYDVDDFLWSERGDLVVYRKGKNSINDWKLWSVPYNGGGGVMLSLNGQEVQPGFRLLSGDRVRYTVLDLGYVIRINGGTVLAEIFADGFNAGNMEAWR